ncbi:hypothetical protein NADE_003512 [Nannochloris sp. 'desiccata']|nr:hypothetical protein NADE_003512 [Chlorella desiccata (nom. nud.)]
MNATDKDLNVQKVLKTTEKNFPSTSKALGNVDRAFDNTKRMKTSYDADSRVLMSVTFKCARSGCHESSGEAKQRRSKKVGCNYELVCTIRRDQPDVVHYEERHGHSGHVPGSTEDLKYLSLHPDIVKLAKEYYINAGMSPQQILYALQANGKVNAITDGKVSRHFLPSLKDIQNIVKQLKVEKHSPFATRMLKCFGGDMIFLDAVYGLSAYGYPILTALVRDDYGNGCPVAFCIADGEEATICSTFLSTIAAAAEMEISHVMMDKSKSQIASCKQLGIKYLLCIFHMLQDFEKFCKSQKSGIFGKDNKGLRVKIYRELRELQYCENKSTFNVKCRNFKDMLADEAPAVGTYFASEWEKDADHWACYGRLQVKHLRSDTNNLLEAFFRKFKYGFARRRVKQRMEDLVQLLVFDVLPHYLYDRIRKVFGIATSNAQNIDSLHEREVEMLAKKPGAVQVLEGDPTSGGYVLSANRIGTSYKICLGDLSCECRANQYGICKHVAAAANVVPVTGGVLERTAKCIETKCLKDSTFFTQLEGSEPDEKLYACKLFSDEARSAIISGWDGGCSCNCYEIGGICAHVMAAAALESIDFSPDPIEEDIPENIDVHLRKRIGVLHGSDPLNGVECAQAELDSVKAVASVQREYSVPKENREGMQACNKLKNVLKELPGPDASYLTAEINNLLEKAKSRRPSLAPTTKAMDKKETKKLSRMPKDRVTRPLYPGRSKSKREDANTVEAPAVALDHAVSVAGAAMLQPSQDPGMEDNGVSPPALVRRNDIGRPREQKRGMENEGLVRHGKAGGLRTPRKRRYKKDDNEVF